MNDELDLVRQLRPPTPDPSAEVVHRHKEHLMQLIDRPTNHRRRPRARIAAAVAIPVFAAAGVAVAAGWTPSAVIDRFESLGDRSDGAVSIDTKNAAIVAEAEAAGYRLELWTAPSASDQQCLYIRSMWELGSATPPENGPVGCYGDLPVKVDPALAASDGSDLLAVLDVFPLGHRVTAGGASPGPIATGITGAVDSTVASLDIDFADGQRVTVDVTDPHGWFASIIKEDITRPDDNGVFANPATRVTLRDGQGAPLATLSSWSQLQAVAENGDR